MDRNEFSNTLDNIIIPGNTPNELLPVIISPIRNAITQLLPNKLYRYRVVDKNNIEALKSDSVYTVTPDKFNDPYDSLIQYDFKQIEELIKAAANAEFMIVLRELIKSGRLDSNVPNYFPNGEFAEAATKLINTDLSNKDDVTNHLTSLATFLLNIIEILTPKAIDVIWKSATYACLSEKIDSITMWSHYANNHQGFALGYAKESLSLETLSAKKCGLFPVIYSDERYDANDLLAWAIYNIMGIKMIEPDKLANIKASLHKSTDWNYEREWRLICTLLPQERYKEDATPIEITPSEIYYGKRISLEDKMKLHAIAIEKGLKEYDMDIDNASSTYQMIIKPSTFK